MSEQERIEKVLVRHMGQSQCDPYYLAPLLNKLEDGYEFDDISAVIENLLCLKVKPSGDCLYYIRPDYDFSWYHAELEALKR